MKAAIKAIEYYLPEHTLSTSQLGEEFPEWPAEKLEHMTGVRLRHVAGPDECASDLGVAAGGKLFASGACQPTEVDYLLLCTESPDHFLPATACLIQDRLGIPTTAGALDFNLGCSGYVYGLGLARGLIETGQARNVLLITAETLTKFIHPGDKSARALFGDAAAATLLTTVKEPEPLLGPFVFGTDGSGAPNLIVPAGGLRRPRSPETAIPQQDSSGNVRTQENLFMDGLEIFNFTLRIVPAMVDSLLQRAGKTREEVDLYVFHQANQYILDHLRKRLKVPGERFILAMSQCGNTVSSSLPIALKQAQEAGQLAPGRLAMLVGFGAGYSWAAGLVRWKAF